MPFKEKFTIASKYIPKPSRRRSGQMINNVRFLVAHDTGNPGSTARQNVTYYINTAHSVPPKQTASAHLFVDDKEILECVPALLAKPEKAWHVLYRVPKDNELYGANANDSAIGVEYCYGGSIDADKAYDKFVWVLAKLCYLYNLDPAKSVVGHFFLDPQRKTDPVTGLAHSRRTYEKLLRDVVEEYKECTGVAVPSFTVTDVQGDAITTARLNIRSLPTTKSSVVQVIAANTALKYTGKVDAGESINNNTVWYKDENGNYFWSGGIQLQNRPVPGNVVNMQTMDAPLTGLMPDKSCFDFIKQKEGLRLEAYQDSAGIWTIGYGTILMDGRRPVKKGDTITIEKANALLFEEVMKKGEAVRDVVNPATLSQAQFDALVSFAYNVGIGALQNSTLLKRIKANPTDPSIREAFMMWDKAHIDGQLVALEGLRKRRKEEADLYFSA